MHTFKIKLADTGHLASIPGIEHDATTLFSEEDLPAPIRYQVTEPDHARDALERKMLWVATADDDQAVGFALADIVDGQAYLEALAVTPRFGRRGIGAELVQAVIEWAREQAYASLMLVTFRHLPWNAPFYARLGFSPVDPSEHGPGVKGLIEEEGANGINVADRVVMRYSC